MRHGALAPCRRAGRRPCRRPLPPGRASLVDEDPHLLLTPFPHLPLTLSSSLPLVSSLPAAAASSLHPSPPVLPARIKGGGELLHGLCFLLCGYIEPGWPGIDDSIVNFPPRPRRSSASIPANPAPPSRRRPHLRVPGELLLLSASSRAPSFSPAADRCRPPRLAVDARVLDRPARVTGPHPGLTGHEAGASRVPARPYGPAQWPGPLGLWPGQYGRPAPGLAGLSGSFLFLL